MVGGIEVVRAAFEDCDFETSLTQGASQTDHHTRFADSACGTGYNQPRYSDEIRHRELRSQRHPLEPLDALAQRDHIADNDQRGN